LNYREHTGNGLGYFRDGLQSFEIFVYNLSTRSGFLADVTRKKRNRPQL
jgi:hypothetical protein